MRLKQLKIFGNQSYAMLASSIQYGLAFITFIFLLRILNPDDLGQWIIYTTLITIAEIARIGLVQNGYIKFLNSGNYNLNILYASGLSLSLVSAAFFSILIILISFPIAIICNSSNLTSIIFYCIGYGIIMSVQRFWEIHWMGSDKFINLVLSKSVYGISFLGGLCIVELTINLNLFIIPLIQVLAAVITVLVSALILKPRFYFKAATAKCILKLLKYGKFVLGTNIGSILSNKAEIFLISAFISPSAVALYNAASRLINVIEIPLTSISQVSYPKIAYEYHHQTSKNTCLVFEKGLGLAISILLPICLTLVFFAEPILKYIDGLQYILELVLQKKQELDKSEEV